MESRVDDGEETKGSSEQQCKEMESRVDDGDSGETKGSSEQQCKEMESRVDDGDSGETKGSSEQDAVDSLTSEKKDAKKKASFVIQNRADLIQKVSMVMPIVDRLGKMVPPELYARIKAEKTSMDQMRELYTARLDHGGTVTRAAFYSALEQHEPHLLESLGAVLPSEDSANSEMRTPQQLKSYLKKEVQRLIEWKLPEENPEETPLNQIFTEVYITVGGSGEVNKEHEVRQIETVSRKPVRPETPIKFVDIFKPLPGEDPIRTVMTKGVAGSGKTVLTQKCTLDWAEDKSNKDIHFMFPFTFRELNLMEKKYSLMELLHAFFGEINKAEICSGKGSKVVFLFDGLDEFRIPLLFQKKEICTDVETITSVDVLLTNLIKGNLLPSARIWITTRPAAANQIPDKYVDRMTEVRGFTDDQKEEYFNKRITDENLASKIISHIKTSRILHIMCLIPVFCWIIAGVLEHILITGETEVLPKTLTEMYIHFMVVQSKQKQVKYDWNPEKNTKAILSMGKLAYKHLEKGNLIFYEKDITECGIDIKDAAVCSGVFTQMFKEVRGGLHKDKVFSFVHLSVQEFLAALYVFHSFINTGVNVLSTSKWPKWLFRPQLNDLYQSAVDKALQSPNGHLDLFLRFLLGLSLETNQTLLERLLKHTGIKSQTNQKTVQYIKKKIRENPSAERTINLFHCLNELNDHSLEEEIQHYLTSGSLSTEKVSTTQWSALAFMLLSSGKELDVFDLKKYSASEEALLRLLPVVKASNRALLSGCNLSEGCCMELSSILSSNCSLIELDLSENDLQDLGISQLCIGLGSPHCTLEILRLSGCMVSAKGCSYLVSALRSNLHLKVLDLNYNHPGESKDTLRSAGQLQTLSLDHGGECRLKPGVRKYVCELTLDPNTAYRKLSLSENNKKATWVRKEQPYPDHPDRFDTSQQVLCRESLPDHCYWEVEWSRAVYISVTHRGITRRGDDTGLGHNDKSWSLICDDDDNDYIVYHNRRETKLSVRPSDSVLRLRRSNRVAVYVDGPAGSLSFYKVLSNTLIHLHTYQCTFTEPLCAGFSCWLSGSSVSLCQI